MIRAWYARFSLYVIIASCYTRRRLLRCLRIKDSAGQFVSKVAYLRIYRCVRACVCIHMHCERFANIFRNTNALESDRGFPLDSRRDTQTIRLRRTREPAAVRVSAAKRRRRRRKDVQDGTQTDTRIVYLSARTELTHAHTRCPDNYPVNGALRARGRLSRSHGRPRNRRRRLVGSHAYAPGSLTITCVPTRTYIGTLTRL